MSALASNTEPAIEIRGLTKTLGSHRAVDGLDLTVRAGEILGLLGPNGAGKTTTVRIVSTLVRPDGGSVRVGGVDVTRDPDRVRRGLGLSGQYAAVDPRLTGLENLYLVARLTGVRRREARRRAAELLDRFGIGDAAHRRAATYSGGMRRRLDLAGAVVAAPPVVVLDEPTTGLDPQGRIDIWAAISELATAGSSVLLTTQYLEEADRLADRIVLIGNGRVLARGTAAQMKARVGGGRVQIVLERDDLVGRAIDVVRRETGAEPTVERTTRTLSVPAVNEGDLPRIMTSLAAHSIPVFEAALRRPSLDDVFLAYTSGVAAPSASRDRRPRPGSEPTVHRSPTHDGRVSS